VSGAVKKVTAAPEPETVDLPLLEAGGPDERLFILCGCGHTAAMHNDAGCQRVVQNKVTNRTASYSSTEELVATPCTCPTPREVVYIAGRTPGVTA
jgi:hypothetical protein